MAEIGKRIRLRREELGITQEELAYRLGYKSKTTIAKIENGTNDIVQSKVLAFANALIEGIASPGCNFPLIIMAFICELICSYIGLLALLLIIISIIHRLCCLIVLDV